MRKPTHLLALVACLSLLILIHLSNATPRIITSQSSDPTEDLFKPTIDVTAVYLNDTPFPVESPTPIDPAVGAYVGWSASDIANAVVANLELAGMATAPTTIVLTRDVASTSLQRVTDATKIARGGDPDLAILMSGAFHAPLPYNATAAVPTTYALVLVDRISGSIYVTVRSNSLAYLTGLLAPP